MSKTMKNAIYVGELIDGRRDGHGSCRWADGNLYEGDWRDDKRNGRGVFTIAETGDRYDGEWKNGKAHGYGVMEWTMGTRYEGLWECNKRCGHGIYYYMDGSVYHGDWLANKRNGRGMLLFPDGGIFVGSFVNDLVDGPGRYYKGDLAIEQNWSPMTTEELLALVPTLKPPAGIIPEQANEPPPPPPPAPQQFTFTPSTLQQQQQQQTPAPRGSPAAVPVSYPSPRMVQNGPPSPQAQPVVYPSPRAVPPTPHAREVGAPSPAPKIKAPRPSSAKEAIKEAFKNTQGMFSTTIRGARTKTTNFASIEELRLQRHLLRNLLAERVATKDPKDVDTYLRALRKKGGYDNLLALKLKVTSREDIAALGITRVLHVRKLYAALQEVDASGIFPPHHDSLLHFFFAFFEFTSLDDPRLLTYVEQFDKRLGINSTEELTLVSADDIRDNIPALLPGHWLALQHVHEDMVEREKAAKKKAAKKKAEAKAAAKAAKEEQERRRRQKRRDSDEEDEEEEEESSEEEEDERPVRHMKVASPGVPTSPFKDDPYAGASKKKSSHGSHRKERR